MPRPRLLTARLPVPPVPLDRAEGCWVFGSDGRRYLDASSGLICVNLGHGHPFVVRALTERAARGAFASPGAIQATAQEEYAAAIGRAVHRPDDLVILGVTGTAAVEMAIAVARATQRARGETARSRILTSSLSFHGNSALTLALSGHLRRRPHPDDSFGLGPGFEAPFPGHHRACHQSPCTEDCAEEVAAAIDARGAETVAAVLLEPVNGATGGGYVPPRGYLRRVREICAARGVLLLHDEVLTGLGRTGLPLGAHHAPGGEADITVLSKGLGAGYLPISAVLLAPDVADTLLSAGGPRPLMGTMSATPLQAGVGMAVLSVLDEIGALDRDHVRGGTLTEALRAAVRDLPVVTDLRGLGYLHGIELADGTQARAMARSREHGLLLYPFNGFRPDGGGEGMIVAPPLNASEEEIAFLGAAVRDVLEELSENFTDSEEYRVELA